MCWVSEMVIGSRGDPVRGVIRSAGLGKVSYVEPREVYLHRKCDVSVQLSIVKDKKWQNSNRIEKLPHPDS